MSIRIERRRHLKLTVPSGPTKVKVGFPAGKAKQSVINKAVWNHFGTRRGIPPRPFLLLAIEGNTGKYRLFLASRAKEVLLGKMGLEMVMQHLGSLSQDDVREEIRALKTPPNAQSTIRRKGSSNPLIDTGEMRQSVRYQVGDW